MTGKRKPSEAERACIEAVDDAERDITAELLREFGVSTDPDMQPKDDDGVFMPPPSPS